MPLTSTRFGMGTWRLPVGFRADVRSNVIRSEKSSRRHVPSTAMNCRVFVPVARSRAEIDDQGSYAGKPSLPGTGQGASNNGAGPPAGLAGGLAGGR